GSRRANITALTGTRQACGRYGDGAWVHGRTRGAVSSWGVFRGWDCGYGQLFRGVAAMTLPPRGRILGWRALGPPVSPRGDPDDREAGPRRPDRGGAYRTAPPTGS